MDLLSSGAGLLLKAGQGGSGADLCVYLMEVYNKGEMKPDTANKARLLGLLRAFPSNEPAKKKFVGGIVEYVVASKQAVSLYGLISVQVVKQVWRLPSRRSRAAPRDR